MYRKLMNEATVRFPWSEREKAATGREAESLERIPAGVEYHDARQ